MKSNNQKELKVGVFLSYLQTGLTLIIGLAYTPVMIRLLGQSEYGLYNTVSSAISALSILSLGFNTSYVKFFSKYKADNDECSIDKLNGLFLIIFMIIGVVALLCGLFLTFNLRFVFKNGLTASEYLLAKKLMALLTISLTISFPFSVFNSIIVANERFIFIKCLGIITTIMGPLVNIPLLLIGFRSMMLVIIGLVLQTITGITNIYYVVYVLKNKFFFHDFEPGIIKELFGYTVFIALNSVIDQVNWNIDRIILGRFCGTVSVSVYSVGSHLHNCFLSFSTSISNVFTPKVHRMFNNKKKKDEKANNELSDLFLTVGRIQFIILALIASGFVFFGREFIGFWVGQEFLNSYYVAMLLILPVSVPLIQNVGIEIQRAMNKHQFRSIVYSIMAIINIGVSVILSKKYGEIGAAAGTAISLVVANGVIMNIYYYTKCEINIPLFWKNISLISRGLIIPIIFAVVLKYFVSFDSLFKLCIGIISYTVVYCCSMWIISMNKYEKDIAKNALAKVGLKNV